MVPLIGYLDRLSARPGESIAVKVSSTLASPYAADLVRIRHADPNPDGPGMKLLPLPADWAGTYPSRLQEIRRGSWGEVRATLPLPESFTVQLRVQPWLPDQTRVVMALTSADAALELLLSPTGAQLRLRQGDAIQTIALDAPILPRRWYDLRVAVQPGRISLSQQALQTDWGARDSASTEAAATLRLAGPLTISFAADAHGGSLFNGRLEAPALLAGETPLAAWDFAQGTEGDGIIDTGPHALHGILHNLPVRAVRGSRWDGSEQNWRHAPAHYAAIHFHEDDLEDCRWQTDFTVTIPPDMPSGIYGVRLRGEGQEDIIPFFVLPPRGVARHKVAYLAATFTYQAYANHARGNVDDAYRARRAAWGAYAHNPDEHPDYGASTYNRHADGSGISLSSRLRPILTLRPGFLTFVDARGSGLRHFSADSHLTDWLEEKGIGFDVLTDEDLDNEGPELLSRYAVVLTGSHPEYHTTGTLDALQSYTAKGGRLCYLGGNGFYWKVARRADRPGVIELRRAEGGIRAWAAEPGEYYHQLDGGYGGLWRRNGRPPQQLAGIGFSAQGLFEGSYYRRLPASEDPAFAWMWDGIAGETLGDFGLSGGGAAGFELDRADPALGTPPNAVILARSEGHQKHFVAVPEELLTHVTTASGERPKALVRGEIVYFETAKGGAVFSVGSITFCGSLSHNGYANPISRLLENVVRRFAG